MDGAIRMAPVTPKQPFDRRLSPLVKAFTPKHNMVLLPNMSAGLIGDYNYASLFTPRILFTKKSPSSLRSSAETTGFLYCCCFLFIMDIFSKFATALVAIPSSLLGGMTTFLFSSVAISGIHMMPTVESTRQPDLEGLLNAIKLVMANGLAVTAFMGLILNLLRLEVPDEDSSLAAGSDTARGNVEPVSGVSQW